MTVRAIGCNGDRALDVLAHLHEELDAGATGVMTYVLSGDGTYTLYVCGDVSPGDIAVCGAALTKYALDLIAGDE